MLELYPKNMLVLYPKNKENLKYCFENYFKVALMFAFNCPDAIVCSM